MTCRYLLSLLHAPGTFGRSDQFADDTGRQVRKACGDWSAGEIRNSIFDGLAHVVSLFARTLDILKSIQDLGDGDEMSVMVRVAGNS